MNATQIAIAVPLPAVSTRRRTNRRFERRAYAEKVIRIDGPHRECGALDLSAGGVGLLSTERVEVGQVVKLAFLARSVWVQGTVAHVRPLRSGDWRVGIRFLRDEPELADVALVGGEGLARLTG